ncbi:DUF3592 domain-containing protein [Haloferula sp. BvORR071]|uniref:DUF3592 domain-containing protein n=1 Tax=Haloferula sp. BvORR071 TaxID=1396141 RepID=UPI000557778F|nr:DUF3592 domain-containing protein [Haloferula sp. BvORR071]
MSHTTEDDSKKRRELRIFLVFYFVILSGITAVWLHGSRSSIAAQFWKSTPCTIERFEIVADRASNPAFRADLIFHYEVDGVRHTGTKLLPGRDGNRDYGTLAEIREVLVQPATRGNIANLSGTEARCFVSRFDPARASLKRSLPDVLAGVVVAGTVLGFFGVFGTCVMLASFRRDPGDAGKAIAILVKAVVLLFTLASLAIAGLFLAQVIETFRMKEWNETQAQVVWSRTDRVEVGKRSKRVPDIFYRYQVEGREYLSNRYSLKPSDFAGEKATGIATSHPEGSKLWVFFDPEKPWRSVIRRDGPAIGWTVLALIPFIALPVGVFLWSGRQRSRLTKSPLPPRRERRPRSLRERSRGKW